MDSTAIPSDTMVETVAAHIAEIGEDTIMSEIDDAKYDFVDSDWDSEYDSLDEAYAETGRGEAESQVCNEHALDVLGADASFNNIAAFVDEMAKQLSLNLQ